MVLISSKRVCQILDITASTLSAYVKRGLLTPIPYGKQSRYKAEEVQALATKMQIDKQAHEAIFCVELGRVFDSIEAVQEAYPRVNKHSLQTALRSGYPLYGQHWTRVSDLDAPRLRDRSRVTKESVYDPTTLKIIPTKAYCLRPGIGRGRGSRPNAPSVHDAKPVLCIETGEVFANPSVAQKELKKRTGKTHHVYAVLRGRCKVAGGYHWKYAEDDGCTPCLKNGSEKD